MQFKKRFVPHLTNINPSSEDFDKLLEGVSTSHIKEGLVVKGQVVDSNRDFIVVDVGLKNECRIPISEFKSLDGHELPNVGDIVDVYVEKIAGRRGTVLSREKAIREESWLNLEKVFEAGENVEGIIFGRVKGGFTVDLNGVIAFLPGSQVDVRPIKDPTSIMDKKQLFRILKMDKKLGNIVASRRAILEESRAADREKMLESIKEGMILKGIVKNITDYGAFVDLGSIDGLLHVTDISWSRINHPSEILAFGQEVEVIVTKISTITKFNEETKRISLGMKQLDENPWKNIKDEFPIGRKMTGKVTNIADYGAFIELKDGIEGLVHSSEVTWGKTNQNPKKLLTIGQEVDFVILDVDTEKNRISLSLKRCQQNPLVNFAEANPVGSTIKAPVRNITDFAIFVEIGENIDGMIHESDISWQGDSAELLKNYNRGDEVECRVLSIDVEKEKVALGIKQLTEDPYGGSFENLKKNAIVTCVVSEVKADGIEVKIDDKIPCFIKKIELSSDKLDQKPERFAAGDRVDAKIINIEKPRKIQLSIKALEIEQRQKVIKEYGSTDSGASLGDILGIAIDESNAAKGSNSKK